MTQFRSKFDLIKHFAELKFTKGAEIGVAEGYFSEAMFKAIPNLELICVDSWTPYKENRWGGSQERNDHHFKKTQERLDKYNINIVKNLTLTEVYKLMLTPEKIKSFSEIQKCRAIIFKMGSMEAIKRIENETLDFVYIDANHSFDYVMQDLIEWSKKVRKGGIVCGDDYFDFKGAGVIEAVDAYCKAHGITPNFTDPYTDKIQDRGCQEQANYWWVK